MGHCGAVKLRFKLGAVHQSLQTCCRRDDGQLWVIRATRSNHVVKHYIVDQSCLAEPGAQQQDRPLTIVGQNQPRNAGSVWERVPAHNRVDREALGFEAATNALFYTHEPYP